MNRFLVGGVAILVLASGGVAAATGHRADRVATEAFISAQSRALSTAISDHERSEAAAIAVATDVEVRCPGALAGDPRNGTTAQQHTRMAFFEAAGLVLALAELRPLRDSVTAETRTLRALRWTRASINRTIRGQVNQAQALLTLKPPDICTEAGAAASAAFTVVPAKMAAFLKAALPAADSDYPPEIATVLKMMRPYMTVADVRAARRLNRLHDRLDNLNANFGLEVFAQMLRALFGS